MVGPLSTHQLKSNSESWLFAGDIATLDQSRGGPLIDISTIPDQSRRGPLIDITIPDWSRGGPLIDISIIPDQSRRGPLIDIKNSRLSK